MPKPPSKKLPAVFLDRDGTLVRDVDYCGDPKAVAVFDRTGSALRRLKEAGYKLVVVTNQSGIARKYFTENQYREVETEVLRQIGPDLIDATYFCPHLPSDDCSCRKPSPQMVLQAARDHNLDLARSFFIGDKESDLKCGRNAGLRTILVRTGYGRETDESLADFVARDLNEATEMIIRAAL